MWLSGVPVMEHWEVPMLRTSVQEIWRRIHPRSVLEFGFGWGKTADAWDALGVDLHVIVEPHPEIIPKAMAWAKYSAPGTKRILIADFAQNVRLDQEFDLIYDDAHDFTGELQIPYTGPIKHFWYARMAQKLGVHDCLPGFLFDVDGQPYYQSLVQHQPYFGGFYANSTAIL